MSKVAVCQMVSSGAIGPNLLMAQGLIEKAVEQGAQLIILPEVFALMQNKAGEVQLIKEFQGQGRIQDFIRDLAKRFGVWIIAGTIPLHSEQADKAYAASIVFDDQGEQVACYKKIHLFDVYVAETGEYRKESADYQAGSDVVVVDTPVGRVGLSVCFDLRFPELYRKMAEMGAEIFAVPSAFLAGTGRSHWRTLLRARAIENQCYVLASNQGGIHDNGEATFGNSMIIDPWGEVLGRHEVGVGLIVHDLDLIRLQVLREEFPVLAARKL